MIGNDVVDIELAKTESNWRRKGYLNKLFTAQEQACIYSSPNPDITVWMLWSMKEAAYKIYNRQTGERGFFPLRLVCSLEGMLGTVTCNDTLYYTQTEIKDNLIHTIAVIDTAHFGSVTTLSNAAVTRDSAGLPYVANKPVSVSHHGRGHKVVGLI